MIRKFLSKIIIALLSLIITLGGLEIALRIFKASPLYEIRHGWHQYSKKNYYNSLVFRDKEHKIEKPQNTFRIVFVGDSFTEAYGVQFDKGYSQVLTSMLNQSSKDKQAEAIVCAKWGSNSIEELRFYKKKCEQFNPDVVVIGYVLNDIEGDKNDKERKEFLYSLQIFRPQGVWYLFYEDSALFRFFYLKKEYFRIRHAWIKGYNKWYGDTTEFRNVKRSLLEFKRLTSTKNQKLIVALLPTLDYELTDNNPFLRYYRLMLDFLNENKIDSCYLYPYFNRKNTIELQVNPGYDSHPNDTGHQIIAKGLYDCLARIGVKP